MIPKTLKQFEILVSLYKVKKGTIKSLAKQCGVAKSQGILYRMRPVLVQYGILKEVKVFDYTDILKTHYTLDVHELDRFIMTETFLNVLYDKIWKGDFTGFIKMKKKGGWLSDKQDK